MAQLPRLKVTGQGIYPLTFVYAPYMYLMNPVRDFSLNFTQISFSDDRQRLKFKVTLQGHAVYPLIHVLFISLNALNDFH